MKKYILVIVAIAIIFASTACSQNTPPYWWIITGDQDNPQVDTTIRTVPDLYQFLTSSGSGSAKLNLTADPDSSYFPMVINGSKTLSGSINLTGKEVSTFSNTASRTSTTNTIEDGILFQIADNASVKLNSLEVIISNDVADNIEALIEINNGSLDIDNLSITSGTKAIKVGKEATSINITGNLSSLKITVSEGNTNKDAIANEIIDITGATVDVGGEIYNNKYELIDTETYKGYSNFSTAFTGAPANSTIKIMKDFAADNRAVLSKTLTLDLNGHKVTIDDNIASYAGGLITIGGNGNLTVEDSSIEQSGTFEIDDNNGTPKLYAVFGIIPLDGQKASLTINGGSFTAPYYAIAGHGEITAPDSTMITINDGYFASTMNDGLALYHPQNGTLIVNGGEFIGSETAIEMRTGKLTINDGKFTATLVPAGSKPNPSGSSTQGAAIGIAQHTTKLPINVTIKGGEFYGCAAVYESNPHLNDAEAIATVNISITGGNFNATYNGKNAIYSEDVKNFITGGTFNTEPNAEYIAEGYEVVASGSSWIVQ